MLKRIKKWKVAVSIMTLALVLAVSTVIVFAFYMSRVYIYTDESNGKQLFRIGMELNTFFDQINSGTTTATTSIPAVAQYTPLGIKCTAINVVKQTNGADNYDETTVDGVTYITNKTSGLCVKQTGSGDTATYEYVYNSAATWGGASNPYLISRINHLQNLYVLQNVGYFEANYSGTTEEDMPYLLVCTSLGTPVAIDGTDKTFEYIGTEEYPFIGYLGGAFVTADADEKELTATVNNQTSTQSVIYNITVQTDNDVVDIGLFGKIGYRGNASDLIKDSEGNETATFNGSVSTVRDLLLYDVKVQVKDKSVWTAIVDIAKHLFTYEKNDDTTVPHETHHIGILAGHVEYATIEYISVYYSSDDIPAIDVDRKTESKNGISANFYSVSGILGYVVNMNSTQSGGVVTIGGTDNDDIAVSGGGDGTGGGLESGEGRGYVTAAEIFDSYSDSGKIVKATTKDDNDNDVVKYGLLVQLHDTQISYTKATGTLTKPEGTTGTTNVTLADGTAVSYSSDFSYVTTYSTSKNFWGITEVTTRDWYNYIVHDLTKAEGSAEEYFYFKKDSDGNVVKDDNGEYVVVYATDDQISRSGVSLKFAAKYDSETKTFDALCTQYVRERVGSSYTGLTQTTGRYYFYDGVFTFALAEQTDTIEETWTDGVDSITVGIDDDSKWTQDTSGVPDSVVALIKPVKTVNDLQSNKPLFIAYKDGDSYHIVTLAQNSTYTAGDGDDAVTTAMTTLSLAGDTLTSAIGASITNGSLNFEATTAGTSISSLQKAWSDGELQVLTLGTVGKTTLSLDELKEQYQVDVSWRAEDPSAGFYEDDGTTALTSSQLSALQVSAKVDTTGTYYSIESIAEYLNKDTNVYSAYSDSTAETSYGSGFTFFTLEGSATVDLDNIKSAVDTNNTTYTSLESGNEGNTVNISSMQSAITLRNNKFFNLTGTNVTSNVDTLLNNIKTYNGKYYNLNGGEVTAADITSIRNAISTANGKYYNLSGTEVTLSDIIDAIRTRNNKFYDLSGNDVTDKVDDIKSAISEINEDYFALGTANNKDHSKITNIATVANNLANIKNTYYWSDDVTNVDKTTDTPAYFNLTSGATASATGTSGLATIKTNSINTYLPTADLYEDDWKTLITGNSASTLSNYSTIKSGGSTFTQTEKWLDQGYWYWTGPVFSYYSYYFVKMNSEGNFDNAVRVNTVNTAPSSYFSSSKTVTLPDGKNSYTVYTKNSYTGRIYYNYTTGVFSVTNYYREGTSSTNSGGVSESVAKTNCVHSYTATYYYIIATMDGTDSSSVSYTFGGTDCTCTGTTNGKTIQDLNRYTDTYTDTGTYKYTWSGTNYKLYDCDLHTNCVLVTRYNINCVFIETTYCDGIKYSCYTGDGTVTPGTISDSGKTVTLNGKSIKIWKDTNGHLGVMVANYEPTGILLASTASASGTVGTKYSVINGEGDTGITWNGTSEKWNIGQTVSANGITYNIYRGTDGRFGVLAENNTIDGILVRTLTGGGYKYSLIKPTGTSTVTVDACPTSAGANKKLTVGSDSYDLYIGDGKYLGIYLEQEKIDGVLLQTATGAGYEYSLIKVNDSNTETIDLSSSEFTDSIGANFTDEETVGDYTVYKDTVGKYLGVRLENERIDGILLKTLTGSGYAYSVLKADDTLITSQSSNLKTDFTTVSTAEKTLTVSTSVSYPVYSNGTYLGVQLENMNIDGILLQTLTGNGYEYSLIKADGSGTVTGLTGSGITINTTYNANIAVEKEIDGYDVYRDSVDGYLGIRLENEKLDGILLTSLTGEGEKYSLVTVNDSGAAVKQADITGTFTSVAGTANLSVLKTLTVDGNSYIIYSMGGKLGIKAQNFVIDGVMLQTQTGTGVTYSLINTAGTTSYGLANLTFTMVAGRTLTVDGTAHQVYLSSNGHYCIRVANIKTDGYAISYIVVGGTTNYKFTDSNGTETVLSSSPKQLGITVPLSKGTETKNYSLYVCDGKLGIELVHIEQGQTYYYTFSHAGNTASSGATYYLRIMKRTYSVGSSKYGMIVSTDANLENTSQFGTWLVPCRSITDSKDCTVILNVDSDGNPDGTAYLQYTVSGETRYLAYSTSGKYFNSSSSQSTASKLYLFTCEGTYKSTFGETMAPLAGTAVGTYSADQYVLWPQSTYDSTDTTTTTDSEGNTTTTNNTADYNPSNDYVKDTVYTIKSLDDLYQSGWKNKLGGKLTDSSLSKVFSLGDGISDVNMINLWGGNTGTIYNSDGYVKAPVGTTGEEAYIPTGCVAFRVNKTLETNKIRVIVAVPVSEYYYGEVNGDDEVLNPSASELDYSKDYCFCMWKIDEANTSTSYSFSASNCYASFELPRSTPYDPTDYKNQYYGELASSSNYDVTADGATDKSVKKYIQVQLDGDTTNTYRAYLNGEQVLVAYEFDATEEGIYLLGSTKECRIVYFSADSTASEGKDGIVSYKVGTIDFVYDNAYHTVSDDGTVSGSNGTKVLTVRDTNKGTTAVTDYSLYYYASLVLLYTDNTASIEGIQENDTDKIGSFPNINNFVIYIRRVATATVQSDTTTYGSSICWQAKNYKDSGNADHTYDAAYIQLSCYAVASDDESRRTNGTIERTTEKTE